MKPKITLVTPKKLAGILLDDLDCGRYTHNGDRVSNYFVLGKAISGDTAATVSVCLIEEKANLPQNEQGYTIHVVNDIDGADCYQESTNTLDEQELVTLLTETMKALNCAIKED